jgi:hypothetical protein
MKMQLKPNRILIHSVFQNKRKAAKRVTKKAENAITEK